LAFSRSFSLSMLCVGDDCGDQYEAASTCVLVQGTTVGAVLVALVAVVGVGEVARLASPTFTSAYIEPAMRCGYVELCLD